MRSLVARNARVFNFWCRYTTEKSAIDRFEMCSLAPPKPYSSCLELLKDRPDAKSGVYTMTPYGQSEQIKVYCDMTTKGGG